MLCVLRDLAYSLFQEAGQKTTSYRLFGSVPVTVSGTSGKPVRSGSSSVTS